MTATSGNGICLMQENIGYACITETPMVVVDCQRAGPATGAATKTMQGDFYTVRYGSNADYAIIALAPSSPQEMFDLTIEAFNLSEQYRVPCLRISLYRGERIQRRWCPRWLTLVRGTECRCQA
jgi:2-oxoglutarate ferredoxin oxidoreductase subunit alpha